MTKKVCYTIDEEVLKEFNDFTKRDNLNKSELIEVLMQHYISMEKKLEKLEYNG